MKNYCVYILANKRRGTLYVGVTGELQRRMIEHKQGKIKGFTQKYDLKVLVYVELYKYVKDAIRREKMLKNWRRESKINLIEEFNSEWEDLYDQYFGSFSEHNSDI
jgi:putative endonuclease